jgi:dCMP deaminase
MKKIRLNESRHKYLLPVSQIPVTEQLPFPFLLVLPSGMNNVSKYRTALLEAEFRIIKEISIENFSQVVPYIYPITEENPATYLWLMLSKKLFKKNHEIAYCFVIEKNDLDAYKALAKTKKIIRAITGVDYYNVEYNGQEHIIQLHHIHSPDIKEAPSQYNAIINVSKSTNGYFGIDTQPNKINIQKEYLLPTERDFYFMDYAKSIAKKSECKIRQVGAVLVQNEKIIGSGFNRFPKSISSCWCSTYTSVAPGAGHPPCFTIHAEQIAILTALTKAPNVNGLSLYTTCCPCIACAKLIIEFSIENVFYCEEYVDSAGKNLLSLANINLTQIKA